MSYSPRMLRRRLHLRGSPRAKQVLWNEAADRKKKEVCCFFFSLLQLLDSVVPEVHSSGEERAFCLFVFPHAECRNPKKVLQCVALGKPSKPAYNVVH